MKKHKFWKFAINIVVIIAMVVSVNSYIKDQVTSKDGETVSEEQMLKDFKAFLHIEHLGARDVHVKIIENGLRLYGSIDAKFEDDKGIVDKNKKVVDAFCASGPFSSASKPVEMRFLARTFLYCKSRALPYDIIGYRIEFKSIFLFTFAPTNEFKISNSELEKIYLDYGMDNLKGEQQIEEFAKAIIKEKKYRRLWSPSDDYLIGIAYDEIQMIGDLRKELLTQGITKISDVVVRTGGFKKSYNAAYKEIFPIDKNRDINDSLKVLDVTFDKPSETSIKEPIEIRAIACAYLFLKNSIFNESIQGYRFCIWEDNGRSNFTRAITKSDIDTLYNSNEWSKLTADEQVDKLTTAIISASGYQKQR